MAGMCAPWQVKYLTVGMGCIEVFVACFMVCVTDKLELDPIAQVIPEYGRYIWILRGILGGLVIATVILSLIPVSQKQPYNGHHLCGLLVLIICAIWAIIIGEAFKQLRCSDFRREHRYYDNVVIQTGTRNMFCTPSCHCDLPNNDVQYDFRWEDVRYVDRGTHNRLIQEHGNQNTQKTSILDCSVLRPSRQRTLQQFAQIENDFPCSGWCQRANMQTLGDSLTPVTNANLAGFSCFEASHGYINKKHAQLRHSWFGLTFLLIAQFFIEALAGKLITDDKDKQD